MEIFHEGSVQWLLVWCSWNFFFVLAEESRSCWTSSRNFQREASSKLKFLWCAWQGLTYYFACIKINKGVKKTAYWLLVVLSLLIFFFSHQECWLKSSPGQYWGVNCSVVCVKCLHSLQSVPPTKLDRMPFHSCLYRAMSLALAWANSPPSQRQLGQDWPFATAFVWDFLEMPEDVFAVRQRSEIDLA